MKDRERRDEEEKRGYIFAPNLDFKEGRSNWITNNLLGDIRTFLDGIENYTGNKEKFAFKPPRGGGNLSAPILISTALEFVAELYAGKTGYMLCFTKQISEELQKEWKPPKKWKELNIENLTNKIKEIFNSEGFKLRENAFISSISKTRIEIDNKYLIIMKKEEGKLKVYEKYNATDNAKSFIKDFFPEKYRQIPLLLWDGIRNGLVHTFSPKPFEYKGSYIQFQFYVENQNFPSHIEKVKGYLFGIDTNAKFEADLNKGEIPEELKNNFKTMNLPLPNTVRKEGTYLELTDGVDTLYVLEKEDKEKINAYNYILQIRINVFELYRVLEKAVEAYLAELENSADLQNKFIRAWSSIEEYTENANDNQSNEVEKLREDLKLDSKSSAFLLKDLNDGTI